MCKIRLLRFIKGIYSIVLIGGLILALGSCRDGGSDTSARGSTSSNTSMQAPATNNIMSGSDAASAEYHYICANGCESGGADAAGPCPECGEELVHNASFHSGGNQGDASASQSFDPANQMNTIQLPDAGASSQQAQSAGGEFHFMCSAGCGDGGSSQGSCPTCGAALVHNDAFHSQQQPSTNAAPVPSSGNLGDPKVKYPSVFNTQSAPRAAVPSQGGGGSGHHYICSAGCGGGAGSQGSCPSCGAALVHNDAFH